ncbi:MAG: GxxExxY protein [Acetobacteraceae bacterium]
MDLIRHKGLEGQEGHEESGSAQGADITGQIIGLAIKVHRRLGPGLLESVYEKCLCWELERVGLAYARQVSLDVIYDGMNILGAYRADIIVQKSTLLEIKAIERILPVHEAQALTYLRLSGCTHALLLNFNTVLLKDELRRFAA